MSDSPANPATPGDTDRPRIPWATYRLQLRNGLTLDGVVDDGWLDHAASLGVSHLYLSPVLRATPGSSHGYDVVDPRRVDEVLGGEAALERLRRAAEQRGLGLVIDIVPNHMAADPVSNRYWWDVLRNGMLSDTWNVFDIDEDHPEPRLRDRIMWPVLDDRYGRVLEDGRLTLGIGEDQLVVLVDDRPLPMCPSSAAGIIREAAAEGDDDGLRLLASALSTLDRIESPEHRAYQDATDTSFIEAISSPGSASALSSTLDHINSDPDRVHEVLEAQRYRLAYWRSARDLGYRRFFDVNELIGIRQEDPRVFDWAHERIRQWVDDGLVDGLRVDHPDGLAQPARYFGSLRAMLPDGWIVAEKILESGEALPADWPVDGTTGYDIAELISQWFLDPEGLHQLGSIRDDLVGESPSMSELVAESKRLVLSDTLSADLNRVTDALLQLCESLRRFRDVTRHGLHEMLREIAIAYPVYRSYVAPDTVATERDLGLISMVVGSVRENRPDLDAEVLDLIESVLTGRLDGDIPAAAHVRVRFEQLTGPAMAKGKEDTAFYRDVRLISRCEVGAEPSASGLSTADLHSEFTQVSRSRPRTMTLLSSHDSKRSEDVRARLSVLSEVSSPWRGFANDAMALVDGLDPEGAVDRRTRYMLLQTIVGAHPLTAERLVEFALKAVREAKEHTSWMVSDPAYEDAVERLCEQMCSSEPLISGVERFVEEHLLHTGQANAIAQKVLQLLGPGIPDIYWGAEDWYFRLVDPDNRTTPDLSALRTALAEATDSPVKQDGIVANDSKLGVVAACLSLRSQHSDAFGRPDSYSPLEVSGADSDRVVAFGRGDSVAVVVSRWPSRGAIAAGTEVTLPSGNWRLRVSGFYDDSESPSIGGVDLPDEGGSAGGHIALAGSIGVAGLLGTGSVAVLESLR